MIPPPPSWRPSFATRSPIGAAEGPYPGPMRVAFVTTDDPSVTDEDVDRPAHERAFAAAGIDLEYRSWTAPADWDAYDLVVIRSPWDYPEKAADFLAWLGSVEHLATLKKALGDQQNVTANVSGQLQAHTQHTVAHAFGEAANGEDQAHTVEEVQARWDRLVQRWERQISDSETLQAWQQQCTTLLDNCAPLLSTTPSPKRPKP